ncbi:MAG: sugar transferase [Alphaproteobacteria bacterium]|nr:sugar transferase [Alphaproteobacteria bacterium]
MTEYVETNGGVQAAALSASPGKLTRKRIMDVILASTGIIVLSPLIVLCFLLTRMSSPGPAIFRHHRVGFGGKGFYCLKFRTMVPDAPERLRTLLGEDPAAAAEWAACQKLRCDPRITPVGAIFRKLSLDEIPQLFNVLYGDMSFVGPRPVTVEELDRYSSSKEAYLSCRPGITGLWQVSGRNSTTFDERVAHDTFYARNWSIWLDLKIVLRTVPTVLSGSGW